MNQKRMSANYIRWICIIFFGVLLIGCYGPPQVNTQNRRLLESLKTAVMAKNSAWMEENAKLIEARKEEEKLSELEYDAFASVIREARAGNWPVATDEIMRLAKAQTQSAEQIEQRKDKTKPKKR